jgi:hypothetical protein
LQEIDMNNPSEHEVGDKTPVPAVGQRAIVLATHSGPEENGDCDYAVVQLTPELTERVRRRAELAHQAGQQDVASNGAARQWLNGLERDGHSIVPAAADLAACEAQRVECQLMVVRCSPLSVVPHCEIAWSAMPKHMDMTVTTGDLPLAALEGYLRDAGLS